MKFCKKTWHEARIFGVFSYLTYGKLLMGQHVVILYAARGVGANPAMGDKAWIFNFGRLLSALYQQISRKELSVYFVSDTDRKHVDRIREADVLLVLVTQNLQEHPDLLQLADDYLTQRQQEILVAGKYRFIKVMRCPAPVGDIFPRERYIASYRFYTLDRLSNTYNEFSHRAHANTSRAYWLKLMDVAQNVLHVFHESSHGRQTQDAPIEKTIFLADVADDMVYYRDVLRREMEHRGYRVLPQVVRLSEQALEKGTMEDLRKACLSVHLVGEGYGRLVEKKEHSIMAREDALAHEHLQAVLRYNKDRQKKIKFSRLIWLQPGSRYFDDRQKLFISHLRNEAASIEESEVLEVALQELKTTLFVKLDALANDKVRQSTADNAEVLPSFHDKPSVYLIHDKQDQEEIAGVAGILVDAGFAVLSLPSEATPHALRRTHQHNLSCCDASLIYLCRGSSYWLNTKLQDVMKAPAFGRRQPMRGSAVLLNNNSPTYNDLHKYITVIKPENGVFTRDVLARFMGQIK